MHKQRWYADLTQNQLGIWYMIWKFISKKTLGREAIKIITLVNTPKGEQNSLASCSPLTDLIKSINIYNIIQSYPYRWLIYVSCVVYSTTLLRGKFRAIVDEAFSVKASVLSQTAPESSHRYPIPARRQADVSSAGRGRILRGVTSQGGVAFWKDRFAGQFLGVFQQRNWRYGTSARRYINVVNSMS